MKVGEKDYQIVEDLGYCHSRGCYAKVVLDGTQERVVIKEHGEWIWATPLFVLPQPAAGHTLGVFTKLKQHCQ